MSVPCEEIRPELEALLGAMTEGHLDLDGRRRLSVILRDHPDARQIYLDYCQMHALLESAHGVLQALERPARRRGWIVLAAAAAVLVAVGSLLWAPHVAPTLGTTVQTTAVLSLLREGRRVSMTEAGPMREGDRLRTEGEGRTEVRFRDGTTVDLAPRTEVRFGRSRVDLAEGTIRCEAAPQAPGHPLVFSTRHADVSIVGTLFELSSTQDETRLRTLEGRVRLSSDGRELDVKAGEMATTDGQRVVRWEPVCALDFAGMKQLPSQFETIYCRSDILHTAERKIEPAEDRLRLVPGGVRLEPSGPANQHGLVVSRWKEDVGDDVILEAEVVGGARWSLGFSVGGDSFEGYRIIFAVYGYPNGISIDTIHPIECIVLAADPRNIAYERDHVLRVERHGRRMRVWIDRELRLDTEITHPLSESRKRTFALSNFGAPPVIRSLRVWKAVAP